MQLWNLYSLLLNSLLVEVCVQCRPHSFATLGKNVVKKKETLFLEKNVKKNKQHFTGKNDCCFPAKLQVGPFWELQLPQRHKNKTKQKTPQQVSLKCPLGLGFFPPAIYL